MKQIILCGNCGDPTRFSNSYLAQVRDYKADIAIVDAQKEAPKRKVRYCKKCTKKAGYKVGKRKAVKVNVNSDPISH
jgi:hypothetical protein